MASTHLSLNYHLIFSTKKRRRFIDSDWRDRLHAYVGGTVKSINAIPDAIGGTADHVHLLIGLRATHRLADVMREIKSVSSKWVHETIGMHQFSWQDGYGAFTVSASHMERVRQYIQNQETHHRNKTFTEEYREFLDKYGVEYDDQYLW